MGLVSKLLSLPAGRVMTQLPTEQVVPMALVLHDLHTQAKQMAKSVESEGRDSECDQWRMVSLYARNVLRAFQRQKFVREHEQMAENMLHEIGLEPKPVDGFIGAQMFKPPSASKSRCIVEVDYDAFAPWVEAGDLIEIDWTAYQINHSGLYIVALEGDCLAIRGFHRGGTYGLYMHEDGSMQPKAISMRFSQMPEGFDIVGRIVNVYKKPKVQGGMQ